MFSSQAQYPIIVKAPPPASLSPPVDLAPSRSEILEKAIADLKKVLGYNRASRKYEMSLNLQTKQRHSAVLHFLYLQRKNPLATRQSLPLRTAKSFNLGKYFSESLVTWEQMWIQGKGIPEGRTGRHTKISSLFVRSRIHQH